MNTITLTAEDARKIKEALKEISAMYGHTWDLENGDLIMFKDNIPRFEKAHGKVQKALALLNRADGGAG